MDSQATPLFQTPDNTPENDSNRSGAILTCARCGKSLRGKQEKYCGRRCNQLQWNASHPERLSPLEKPKLPLIPRIRELFSDGCWRTDREAAAALGVLEGSFAARRRETGWPRRCEDRWQHPPGCACLDLGGHRGWRWETRRRTGSKEREHRLVQS